MNLTSGKNTVPSKVNTSKTQRCYHCGEAFENVEDIVFKKIPLQVKKYDENGKTSIKTYQRNRKFHLECLIEYNKLKSDETKTAIEQSEWDKLYEFVRSDILGFSKGTPLSPHTVKRLLGLRIGQFYPKGNNVRIVKRGYSFKTMLVAFQLCKNKIINMFNTNIFNNQDHKINTMMRIVVNQIGLIQRGIDAQKEREVMRIFDEKRFEKEEELNQKIGKTTYEEDLRKERMEDEKQKEERLRRHREKEKNNKVSDSDIGFDVDEALNDWLEAMEGEVNE